MSSYALPVNLLKKSVDELRQLREGGLTLLYYGIETGSADLLKRITKGATPEVMVTGLTKAKQAGLTLSATVILGWAGKRTGESNRRHRRAGQSGGTGLPVHLAV